MDINVKVKKSTLLRPKAERMNIRGRETLDPLSRAASLGIVHNEPTLQELLERSLYRSDRDHYDVDNEDEDFDVFDGVGEFVDPAEMPEHTPFTEGFVDKFGPTSEAARKTLNLPSERAPKGKKRMAKDDVDAADSDDPASDNTEE